MKLIQLTIDMTIIMMIDDDESAHFYHKLMLEETEIPDVQVVAFTSSVKALKHLRQCLQTGELLPNVLLVDINMPELNGWEFIEALQPLKSNWKPEIYVVSHSESPRDKQKAAKINVPIKQKFLTSTFFQNILSPNY